MPAFFRPPRRAALIALAGFFASTAIHLCSSSGLAQAQDYPTRAIRLVVPFPPGGGTDGAARALSQRLAEALGQAVVVENRPGGGGLVAWSEVSRAAPDGHTLVLIANNLRLYPVMQIATSFDPDRDLVPVATLASVPMALVASRKAPAGGFKELVQDAKSTAGKVNSGTVGNGSPHHLASARLAGEIGATFTHIPYKGTAPLVTDLLGDQIEIAFVPLSVALPHLRNAKLRSLGVAQPQRSRLAPDLATLAENGGPSFDASYWFAVAAPRATADAVMRRLNSEIVKILDQAPMKESLARQGFEPMPASLAQSAQHLADEVGKWSGPIKAFGIRADP